MREQQKIFNISQHRIHRDRAALRPQHALYKHVAHDLNERLSLCKLPAKSKLLEFGGRGFAIDESVLQHTILEKKISADISYGMLERISSDFRVQCSEESLPFNQNEFDIIVSNLHMHWSNNIPLILSSFYRILQSKGVFLLAMVGGKSLSGLRDAFVEVEKNRSNIKYHISPMVKLESLSLLMQKSGFKDIVVDSYCLRLEYENFDLMLKSLQNMGESNCLIEKVSYLRRDVLSNVRNLYGMKFGSKDSVYCEIEILNAIGHK
jgi:SAM-dependent methyltransferase